MNAVDSTVDAREVDYYTRMADAWWDSDGAFWPLHTLNRLRVSYIRSHVCRHFSLDASEEKPLKGLRILDVGCGGGILSESMAKLGAHVTGIDMVEKNIRVASLHARQQGLDIDYRNVLVGELASESDVYDVVLNMEVVEHVADVAAFMRDCSKVTSPEGLMFVATINRNLLSWLFAIVGAEYILRWLPRGTHRWGMFQKPTEIATHLNDGGLEVVDRAGVQINPVTRKFRLTRSLWVNYMLVASGHGQD
ncbi:MAG: bifunctional 2-polyprenyl-6-hydroxyphenol methylase/3-demethylubiquinol 3-O-methyltransferase UbiG [Gammaproteobacteria bacterium]|nr:bifunctional 2-polyprenyl-6-hydroxyphenol methylase/3-demethylubiquinol 3-O-methyltransferase UbiG [Gammaproteobacteria bacterium]